jgi:nucleotide-binding universal stress UspA family protein
MLEKIGTRYGMAKVKKILVPVDGSECSLRALKHAAQDSDAMLLVLHVQPAMPSSRTVTKQMIAEHQARHAAEALQPAQALITRLKVNADTYTAVGDPAAVIASFAKKHRCSALVMGNRGHGKLAGLLLGSVALKVIQLAECPVTLVK